MTRNHAARASAAQDGLAAPRGLSRIDAAAYIGIGTTLFDQLVVSGEMPKPFRIRGRVLWDRRRLDAAIDDLQDAGSARDSVWDNPR
jgi:predicted DNA-binding transcriptional regulator AlpA